MMILMVVEGVVWMRMVNDVQTLMMMDDEDDDGEGEQFVHGE